MLRADLRVARVALSLLVTLAFAAAPVPAQGQPVIFDASTPVEDRIITCNDLQYETFDVTVIGVEVTVDCVHTFNSLTIISGGTLRHSDSQGAGLQLFIATDLFIDATSRIHANGAGFGPGLGPGAGNVDSCNIFGDLNGSGGAYGGNGGRAACNVPGGSAYGPIELFDELGSGGADTNLGGPGGGLIVLEVQGTLTVEGEITAHGGTGVSGFSSGGGGSAGAVRVSAGVLIGSGTIAANGGNGGGSQYSTGGGGGGGRIAIDVMANSFDGPILACGGWGWEYGGAGTVYVEEGGTSSGDLKLSNCGHSGAASELGEPITVRTLEIEGGATLSHPVGGPGLDVTAMQSMELAADGAISASAKGLGPGEGAGAAGASACNIFGDLNGSGGGYGGNGGAGACGLPGGAPYATFDEAAMLGSGGGDARLGGHGGGAIRLVVPGIVRIDGIVAADGGPGVSGYSSGGGGSGGSIEISANVLLGSGTITADGGSGGSSQYSHGGGGAGGRVVLFLNYRAFAEDAVWARGGSGWQRGGAGTIYQSAGPATTGSLRINNGGNDGATTDVAAVIVVSDLQIGGGAALSHPAGGPALDVQVLNDVTVDAGGRIAAGGRGHGPAAGPGAGGATSCNIFGDLAGSGGGYGGAGGISGCGLPGGPAYGSPEDPLDFGSGGGHANLGGAGGGLIVLDVGGALVLDGEIEADGRTGTNDFPSGGGGSGGGINITATTVVGTGSIRARGGDGGSSQYTTGGGGGGGRIAVVLAFDPVDFSGTLNVNGGSGPGSATDGQTGTIWFPLAGVSPPNFIPEEFVVIDGEPTIEDIGDLTGDGTRDVVIAIPFTGGAAGPGVPGRIQVYRNLGNDGQGQWQGFDPNLSISVGVDPSGVTIGNLNGDAFLDVAVSNAGDDTVFVFINDGMGVGTFALPIVIGNVGDQPSAIVAADFSGDGLDDLAVALAGDDQVVILFNQGNVVSGLMFEPGPPIDAGDQPVSLAAGDIDLPKGVEDLIVANLLSSTVSVMQNLGDGMMQVIATLRVGMSPTDLAVGDFNADTFADIVTSNNGVGTLSVIVNNGNLTFEEAFDVAVGEAPVSVDAALLDEDGDVDLAVVAVDGAIGGPAVQVLSNLLDGGNVIVFGEPQAFNVLADPNFVVSGDLNDDGLNDLVTVNADAGTGGSVTALLNALGAMAPCPWDLDGDGMVGISDFLGLLLQWGSDPGGPPDFNGDGAVGPADFLALLFHWGPCPS